MKKIHCILERGKVDGKFQVLEPYTITPGCEWVFKGRGIATIKWDGTAVMINKEGYFKRRTLRNWDKITPPPDFIPCPPTFNGKMPGWFPVTVGLDYHWEAYENSRTYKNMVGHGTYELIGPKFQGNPYDLEMHVLKEHGAEETTVFPIGHFLRNPTISSSVALIHRWLDENHHEGIVFHHHRSDKMAKITRRDFGLDWPIN